MRAFLRDVGYLYYNNGDPVMFNPVANAILQSASTIRSRGHLVDATDPDTYRKIAHQAVCIVCGMQRDLAREASERWADVYMIPRLHH